MILSRTLTAELNARNETADEEREVVWSDPARADSQSYPGEGKSANSQIGRREVVTAVVELIAPITSR